MTYPGKASARCPSCKRPLFKHPGLYITCDKLRQARAALRAIRVVSTSINPRIRLEYATAIAEAALEMTK